MKIGCIGQGFVGKNIANDFENRGYSVVRYALEPAYALNRDQIAACDLVFVGVPTPTTPEGFDYSTVENVIKLTGPGSIVVIKSTLLPGTTRSLQDMYTDRVILFSPEFLSEETAAYDVAHPMFNIIGLAYDSAGHRKAADAVMQVLPKSDHNYVVSAQAAELFKYTHNLNGYMRVVLSNLMHDVAEEINADWADVKSIIDADPMMSPYYNSPVHKKGRGAGGHCFVKDMAAFRGFFEKMIPEDKNGAAVFKAMEKKNLELLAASNKSQDLVEGVYGKGKNETKVDDNKEKQELSQMIQQLSTASRQGS